MGESIVESAPRVCCALAILKEGDSRTRDQGGKNREQAMRWVAEGPGKVGEKDTRKLPFLDLFRVFSLRFPLSTLSCDEKEEGCRAQAGLLAVVEPMLCRLVKMSWLQASGLYHLLS